MNLVLYKESNKDVDVITKYLVETHEVNTKKLAQDLYEIKVSKNRFLYCYRKGNKVYVVHAFRKSTQKTPVRYLNLAKKRIKEMS